MLQITLDSNESNKSNENKKRRNWGFKVRVIKEENSSEMILSFEEIISAKEEKPNLSLASNQSLNPIS